MLRWIGAVVAVVVVALVVDLIVLTHRIDELDVRLTSGPGETWVIVGLDAGQELPTGADPGPLTDPTDQAAARADIVIVVHRTEDGRSTALSLPRDLVVVNGDGFPRRLALAFKGGGQDLVDGLCRTLKIPTDHLITLGFSGFQDIVDDLGGIEVTLPSPVRDAYSGLDLASGGAQRLDGATTLALVRSRHPEVLVDGTWTPMPEGSTERTRWAGLALSALSAKARGLVGNPIATQRLAWTATGALSTDPDTGLWDLLAVARAATDVVPVPVKVISDTAVTTTSETTATLQAAGLTDCTAG